MKRLLLIGSGLFAAIVSMGPFQDALAHGADVVDRVLADAKVMANARLRYENVDQAGFAGNAEAFTLRLRAGLVTGATASTKLGIDFEWIESLAGHYNSTTNGKTQFPVVADPQDVELNQLYLQNTSLPKTVLTVGRQRVILDDGRFIGTAGWRQNEQTFDTERYDKNSDYDASTGIFTCVCAGKYKFHAQVVLNGVGASHTRGDPYLLHKSSGGAEQNATKKVLAPYACSVSGFFTYDLHAEFEMAHGDTVECVVNVANSTKVVGLVGSTDTEHTFFSGHLI